MTKEIKAKDRKHYTACSRCGEMVHNERATCQECGNMMMPKTWKDGDDDGTQWLDDVSEQKTQLIQTGPWDKVFGKVVKEDGEIRYGIAMSSINLIGAPPGAGKSTLALQLADSICVSQDPTLLSMYPDRRIVLYVSKEEPDGQIKARKRRLKLKSYRQIRMLGINSQSELGALIERWKPVAIIVDSLKKVAPDPESQVTFLARLKEYTTALGGIGIIISHVNKDEDFDGHMANQHEVDATVKFVVHADGTRELVGVKNRNCPTGEPVLFQMREEGLVYDEELNRILDEAEEEANEAIERGAKKAKNDDDDEDEDEDEEEDDDE